MSERPADFHKLPAARRESFAELVRALATLAGKDLLAVSAFGGWIVNDPVYAETPARSVAVLKKVDLNLLVRLAAHGNDLGPKRVAAPLIMTPEYIAESRDTFPLELLEIQQVHCCVLGEDHFEALRFAPADLRLQAERELKSALIQMRQGLIAATGHRKLLGELCAAAAERCIRVVRGVLHLTGTAVPELAVDMMATAASATGVKLVTLSRAAANTDGFAFDDFHRCYDEINALAAYVDKLPVGKPAAALN